MCPSVSSHNVAVVIVVAVLLLLLVVLVVVARAKRYELDNDTMHSLAALRSYDTCGPLTEGERERGRTSTQLLAQLMLVPPGVRDVWLDVCRGISDRDTLPSKTLHMGQAATPLRACISAISTDQPDSCMP